MKSIILSYDYELFFGLRSGTVKKSLIIPTNKLLDAMERHGQVGNFFVDFLMLKYLLKTNTDRSLSDYQLIEDQLKDIVKRGHRIELHIHPHWVDAVYNHDGTWDFSNFTHYSLNAFSENEIASFFIDGVNLLSHIAQSVNPNYKIVAFRGGGWTIQPFSKLRNAFIASGIQVDSSVSLGFHNKTPYFEYDFREVQTSCKYLYRFFDDVTVEDKDGIFLEVPISSFYRGLFYKSFDRLFRDTHCSSGIISDGCHNRNDLPSSPCNNRSMLMLSWRSPFTIKNFVMKSQSPLLTLIDHPKDYCLSNDDCLKALSKITHSITYIDLLNTI